MLEKESLFGRSGGTVMSVISLYSIIPNAVFLCILTVKMCLLTKGGGDTV